MITRRFDELDRRRVIEAVERHFAVKLSALGKRRKALRDSAGRIYWVLGGVDDWHGVPKEMIEDADGAISGGKLIIAKRFDGRIELFSGELSFFLQNIEKCSQNQAGDRQFNLVWRNNAPSLREIPGMRLQLIEEISYLDEQKDSDRSANNVMKLVEKMSPEEQLALMRTLEVKKKNG